MLSTRDFQLKVAAIHQPNYVPGLRYFSKLAASDVFVLLDSVIYSRRGFTSRNRIKSAAGAQWLTVPVMVKGRYDQRISDVEISSWEPWTRNHLRTVEQAYSRSPHKAVALDLLANAFSSQKGRLVDLNVLLIREIARSLGLHTRIVQASELPVEGHSSELLAAICEAVGADTYLSGQGGRKYLMTAPFHSKGIAVRMQEYEHPEYPQQHGNFLPDMSVIDLLANCGPASGQMLLRGAPGRGPEVGAAPDLGAGQV